MKHLFLITLVGLALHGCTGQENGQKSGQTTEMLSQKTDALVKTYTDLDIFSGVVLIAKDGKPVYQKAFGLSNRVTKSPNTLNTKFVIGSMNKSFTRVLINQLVDEGKLNLEDKMTDYLDGFTQEQANKITLAHLLNHQSGFGDYHNEEYLQLPYSKKNIPGILPMLKHINLLFEPGTANQYSNAGYIILGAIIEKITGKSYANNVEERVAKPLALNDLETKNVKRVKQRAIGYMKTYNGYINNEDYISEPRSDGGFYATAADVLKFYRAFFYDNSLISKKARLRDDFFKSIAPLHTQKGAGIPLAGGFNGANTVHLEMMADSISIVVMANMDEPVAEKIAIGILNIINGKSPEKAQLPAKLNLYKHLKEKGVAYVKEHFEALSAHWFADDPKDLLLNNLGYDLLFDGKIEDALAIFKLNTELFPEVGNCWDSYGEALLKNGDRELALEAYKKALAINPNIPSAKKMVKELEK